MRRWIFVLAFALLLSDCTPPVDENTKDYRLALIQLRARESDKEGTLASISQKAKEAADAGAHLLVFSGTLNEFYYDSSDDISPDFNNDLVNILSNVARKHHIYLCAGLLENDNFGTRQTILMFDRKGTKLLRCQAIEEKDYEKNFYTQGNWNNMVESDLGRLGILCCSGSASVEQALFSTLGYQGADLILAPGIQTLYSPDKKQAGLSVLSMDSSYTDACEHFNLWYISDRRDQGAQGKNGSNYTCAINSEGNVEIEESVPLLRDTIIYMDIVLEEEGSRDVNWYNSHS